MLWIVLLASLQAQQYDVIVRGGMVYDGSGGAPVRADVGIRGDRIESIGDLKSAKAKTEIDARGLAAAPGYINMMSGPETLFADGKSQSDLRQGVTLEVLARANRWVR